MFFPRIALAVAILFAVGSCDSVDIQDTDSSSAEAIGKRAEQVEICHSAKGTYSKISVAANAVKAHRRHGDGVPGDFVDGDSRYAFNDECEVEELACSVQLANICDIVFGAFDTLEVTTLTFQAPLDACGEGGWAYDPVTYHVTRAVSADSTIGFGNWVRDDGYFACEISRPPTSLIEEDHITYTSFRGWSCEGSAVVLRDEIVDGVRLEGMPEVICGNYTLPFDASTQERVFVADHFGPYVSPESHPISP